MRRPRNGVCIALLTAVLLTGAGIAHAFDHLEITVVNPDVVQGRPAVTTQMDFSVRVRAVNGDGSTDPTADFINAELYSPDVPAVLPSPAYLQGGERQFDNLRFLAAGQPVRLRVRDADDPSVPHGEILMNCYNFVDRFVVTIPAGDKHVGQPVNVTLTALDFRADGDRFLEFAGDDIFKRREARLTDDGRRWLTRASDEMRRHPYSPVKVKVVAESEQLAAKRADSVATFLADAMILPREQVETEAVQKVDLRVEMDGSVTIVIEHAR